jgi:hypothetical protein
MHFNSPTTRVVLPSPTPFENRSAQMPREVDAKDGIREKPSNNFAKQPHGEERVIIIDIKEQDHCIFK